MTDQLEFIQDVMLSRGWAFTTADIQEILDKITWTNYVATYTPGESE